MSQKTWILLKPLNHTHYAAPCLLTDEYVIISTAEPQNRGKIYSVHLEDNKWFNIGKLGIDPLRYSAVVDRDKQIVYVYSNTNTSNDIFFEIDIKTQSCIMYKGVIHGLPEGLGSESGGNVELCILNNTIHAIGGYSSALHSIWKNDNDNKINTFIQNVIGNRPKHQSLHGHALVTIESLNQILILGGKDNSIFGGYLRDIWVCQTQKQMQWTKLTETILPHKLCSFGCIKTNDEKYIIIFGGCSRSVLRDEIWILNVNGENPNKWQWKKCKIKCPKKAKYYAVLTKKYVYLFSVEHEKRWMIELSQLMDDPDYTNDFSQNVEQLRKSISVSSPSSTRTRRKSVRIENTVILPDEHDENDLDEFKRTNTVEHMVDLDDDKLEETEETKWKLKCSELQKQLEQKNDEYQKLEVKYKYMLQKEKNRIMNDVSNYENWSYKEIIDWLTYLENGRFEKYLSVLERNMKMEKIGGTYLVDLDKHDVHRLGCTEYGDKIALLNHFQSLQCKNIKIQWNKETLFANVIV
eukprot:158728_1